MPRILSFGEVLWDMLPSGKVLGGAPANFAFRMHTLGHQAVLASRVGADPLGEEAVRALEALGLTPWLVQTDPGMPTGMVEVTLQADGSPDFHILPGVAYDYMESSPELLSLAAGADVICFGTLSQRVNPVPAQGRSFTRETLRRVLQAAPQAFKVLDLNLRKECFTEKTVEQSLPGVDLLKLNHDEAGWLASTFNLPDPQDFAAFAKAVTSKWSISYCVVTKGGTGAGAATAGGAVAFHPGFKVEVVDACGAGDAFTAGFIDALLARNPLAECLKAGNALGALTAATSGATSPVDLARRSALEPNPGPG